MTTLQWGGRFTAGADPQLLSFGSSLDEDLILAEFDVACSLAHVDALDGGSIVTTAQAEVLRSALHQVASEIRAGTFTEFARAINAEDIHGAIDARVRELAGPSGEWLHAGRSRNDQVATTLLLYVRNRAERSAVQSQKTASEIVGRAREELKAGTIVAGCTHRQPAQPVLFAFVLAAWAEPFVRATRRFSAVGEAAARSCPLGSSALAGSGLALDRDRAARALGFGAPTRNALDAIGTRDAALDLAHSGVRSVVDASRIAEELIAWSAPAYGYVRLADSAATGSSLLPQKRNPDAFELVRGHAARLVGSYAGALATLCGLAPSYQRDLQVTKSQTLAIAEEALSTLDAFARALRAVTFARDRMRDGALDGYTIATDLADALIAGGTSPRAAHARVGAAVLRAESEGRALDDSIDAATSLSLKRTMGSTHPAEVRRQIDSLESELAGLLRAGS